MFTAADRYEATRAASQLARLIALDTQWTAELSRELEDADREALLDLGTELVGLVAELPGALRTAQRLAAGDPDEFNRTLETAIYVAETQGVHVDPSLRDLASLGQWAEYVQQAAAYVEPRVAHDVELLQVKLRRIQDGDETPGDIRRWTLIAVGIVFTGLALLGPAAVVAGVPPAIGAVAEIVGIVGMGSLWVWEQARHGPLHEQV